MGAAASADAACSEEHNAWVMKNWWAHQRMQQKMVHVQEMTQKFTDNSDVKPKDSDKVDSDVLPIWVRQLIAGTTHRKRRLTGMVIEDAIFTGGIYFVLEDAVGSFITVGVYNCTNPSTAIDTRLFHRGKCITIIEPHLKVSTDGSSFVCVDNPATDVLTEAHVLPGRDAGAWQLEGKQLFAANMPAAAFECWSRALSFAAASSAVVLLLTNRAAALLRSEKPSEAARDCFVALVIDPTHVKAAVRLVEALSNLELAEVAGLYAQGFAERWPSLKASLQKHSRGARSADWERTAAETLWWEEEVVSKVLFIQSAAEVTGATWVQLKASGNDLFRSSSFEAAALVYSRALASIEGVDVLLQLLCNRAAAALQEENHLIALANATASLVLNPTDVKSWHRRASALGKLGMNEAGLAACAQATQLLEARGENNSAFKPLMKIMTEADTALQAPPKISTAEQKKSLEESERLKRKQDIMGTQQLSAMNMMISTIPEKQQIELFGHKVSPMPPFHFELAKHRGWPAGVDVQWAKDHLHFVYEQCSSLPYSMLLAFNSKDFAFAKEDMLKRANGQPARVAWLSCSEGRKWGDVMPEETIGTVGYPKFFRRPFTNQAYRKDQLSLGTVHVAVGFVDLGVLLSCEIAEAPEGRDGPLRFVGIELSCFAVAKSLILWQMIKDAAGEGNVGADAILQVWFSSTWHPSTEVAFRAAARAVRSRGKKLYGSNEEVARLLEHWAASRGVSLKRARELWAKTVTRAGSKIGNMLHLEDRLDMASYELTGDVFVGQSKKLVGSICWWDCPDGAPANQKDQTFFSATDMRCVLAERSPKQSVFHAAESFLSRRIAKMIAWAGSSTITVEAKVGNVAELVSQIAALKPWTVSWSNVSDYYKPSEFHRIARACSVHGDTIHFAYSMNWSTDVVGSHVIDYPDAERRKVLFEMGYKSMDLMYKGFNFDGVFRYPPPGNPMNVADVALAQHWKSKWVDRFFEIAKLGGPCQVGNVEPAMLNPLSQTGSNTVLFTFTYDPEIDFQVPQAQHADFMDRIKSMSVEELQQHISWLMQDEEKGMTGEFPSAADHRRQFHSEILEEMKKRLASLQASDT